MSRDLSVVLHAGFTFTCGHSRKLKKSRCHTDLRQHFFRERIISWWNKPDEDTVTATSINSFKGKLQKVKTTQMSLVLDTVR